MAFTVDSRIRGWRRTRDGLATSFREDRCIRPLRDSIRWGHDFLRRMRDVLRRGHDFLRRICDVLRRGHDFLRRIYDVLRRGRDFLRRIYDVVRRDSHDQMVMNHADWSWTSRPFLTNRLKTLPPRGLSIP